METERPKDARPLNGIPRSRRLHMKVVPGGGARAGRADVGRGGGGKVGRSPRAGRPCSIQSRGIGPLPARERRRTGAAARPACHWRSIPSRSPSRRSSMATSKAWAGPSCAELWRRAASWSARGEGMVCMTVYITNCVSRCKRHLATYVFERKGRRVREEEPGGLRGAWFK